MDDLRKNVRPILAIISICALIYFYTLATVGYDVPVEINSFWIPPLWWFRDRTVMHNKERKDGED